MGPFSFFFRSISQYVFFSKTFKPWKLYSRENLNAWYDCYCTCFMKVIKNLVFIQTFRFKMAVVQNIQS